jgi:hypothetical protein
MSFYRDPEQEGTTRWYLEGEDEGRKDAGDAGKDPSDEDAEGAEDEEGDERDADDTGDKKSAVPPGFKKRFDKLNEKYKEYRELGLEPSEAKAKLARLADFEEAQAEWKRQQEEQRKLATRDERSEALTDEILQRIESRRPGWLDEIDASQRDRELYARAHNTAGREHLRSLYKEEFGIEPNDKMLARIVSIVGADINADDAMLDAFWDPQAMKPILNKVFDNVKSELLVPTAQALGAETIEKAKRRRESTMSRATPSAGPSGGDDAFKSKHPAGSPQWEQDWQRYEERRVKEIMAG